MINNDTTFFLGYVEQAVGGFDPLNPPISISKNGSLAKWRGKLDFFDLRVNDLGLAHHKQEYEDLLIKAKELGIEVVMTLPEFIPVSFEMVPPMPSSKPVNPKAKPLKTLPQRPEKMVHFKNCYPALPQALEGNKFYKTLNLEDCFPIIELAGKYDVKHVVVPVSQPGVFIDPQTEPKLRKFMKELTNAAGQYGIKLHVRNGGISSNMYKKLAKEFSCGLAYDVGIAQLECDDFEAIYRQFRDNITIVMVQQAYQGFDKWTGRREGMETCLRDYVLAMKDYKVALDDKDETYAANVLKRWNDAYYAYLDIAKNKYFNLGLYQNGDLNVVPLLREIRDDVENGDTKYVLICAVPNTRNNEFVLKNVMPDGFGIDL